MDPTSQPSQWTDSPSPSPFGRLPSPFGPFDEPNSSSWIHEPVDGLPCVPPDAPVTGDSNSQVQETPVQFNTAVDNVVRMIQAKPEILGLEVKAEPRQTEEEKDEGRDSRQLQRGKAKRKRFACDIPGCNKMFAQKNNLDTHRRSHTGESPYPCPYCPRRFTQVVNLNSHINRHTGARPYKCPECPKTFPQRSNVKAHRKTHVARELRAHWICRLSNCEKAFTEKGNLKNHQNTYHVKEIEAFNTRLASVVDKNMLSEKDQDMARYLAEVHNLANKGIKGRGKGRKVKRIHLPPQPPQKQQQQPPSPSASPIGTTVDTAPYPMPLPNHHHNTAPQLPLIAHPFFRNPAAYGMNLWSPTAMFFSYGDPLLSFNTRDTYYTHTDQLSNASSMHRPTPVLYVCEEEHKQGLAFGDRLF